MNRRLAAAVLAFGVTFVTPAAAYAGPGPGDGPRDGGRELGRAGASVRCNADKCDGKDPRIMRCDRDAQVLDRLRTSLGRLELRYSKACHASWARILEASPGTWFYIQNCYGPQVESYSVPEGYTHAYTDMVPGLKDNRVGNRAGHTQCHEGVSFGNPRG